MTLVLNRSNTNKYVDRTDILVELPRNIGLTGALGLFNETFTTQKTIEIARKQYKNNLVKDKNWDEKDQTVVDRPTRGFLQLKIPHFPLRDAIKPSDIDGIGKVDSILEAAGLEQVQDVRLEKMATLQNAHSLTLEAARMQLITAGTVYAPNGTLATSYGPTVDCYTEMGVSRVTKVLPLSGSADPRLMCQEIVRDMRMALRNSEGGLKRILVLCGSAFFSAVITNAYVTDAVKYFQQAQSINILTGVADQAAGFDVGFGQITLWGLTFVDAGTSGYDDNAGTFVPFIADAEAIVIPQGVRNMFRTWYAPANTFSSINQKSKGSYYSEFASEEDDLIKIKTEQNFLNFCLFPQAIFKLTKS
jgi:hypothetical protein